LDSEKYKVAFIGGGLIGSGLAVNCALKGHDTFLQTRRRVELCKSRVAEAFEMLVKNEVITEENAAQAAGCIFYTTSVEEAVRDAEFIQESGPENYETKWMLIDEIEKHCREDAIIASSTSGLLITKIQSRARHPERITGGHPYNPAYIIPLVEITRGEKTSKETAEKAKDFYKSIGKEPVILNKEVSGFIANRIQTAVHREAIDLVMNGVCSVEDVDKAITFGPGIRWGVLGQLINTHLGVEGGIRNMGLKYGAVGYSERLAALAVWDTYPDGWSEIVHSGVEVEIANREEGTGNTVEEVIRYRDEMLIKILKLHKKI
jgi:carnitine 3-dehydrogenase